MAQFGPLTTPYVQGALDAGEQLVDAQPMGDLLDVEIFTDVDTISSILSQRFPVPPAAGGFCIDLNYEREDLFPLHEPPGGLSAPWYLNGAVSPEGGYLEPTIGQIWPR